MRWLIPTLVVAAFIAGPVRAFADANIVTDGNASDWTGITSSATDGSGEPNSGLDISQVYVTDNNSSGTNGYLFFRDDFYGNVGNALCDLANGDEVQLGFGIDGDGDCQISSNADEVVVFTYHSTTKKKQACSGTWSACLTTYTGAIAGNCNQGLTLGNGSGGQADVGTLINAGTGSSTLEMGASFATLGLSSSTTQICVQTGIFASPGTNGIEFGPDSAFTYNVTNPTAAQLIAAAARAMGDGVELRWATGSERDNLGFRIERQTASGWTPVHPGLLAGALHSPSRHAYSLLDTSGTAGDWYRIIDVDSKGKAVVHAAFRAGTAAFNRLLDLAPLRQLQRSAAPRALQLSGATGAFAVRVSAAGLYRLDDADLRAAGLDARRAPRLSHEGKDWPVFALDDGSGQRGWYFYAPAPRHAYDHQDTYVVTLDGRDYADAPQRLLHAPASVNSLQTSQRYEDDHIYWGAAHDADPFMWLYVTSYSGSKSVVLEAPHALATTPAALTVSFEGWSTNADVALDHRIDVKLNGVALGSVVYDGWNPGQQTFTVPAGVLIDGANVLTLTAPGVPGTAYDVNALDRVSLAYTRDLTLDGAGLTAELPARSGVVLQTSLAGPFFAADISDPASTNLLAVDVRAGSLAAAPRGRPGAREIFVAPLSSARVVHLEPLPRPSPIQVAAYTIVTDASLLGAAQVLAQARAAQGYATAIVTTDAIAMSYDGAQPGPDGLRRFLHELAGRRDAPRFVVLLGSANYDVRHATGGAKPDLVPTQMIRTGLGVWAASDLALATDPGEPLPPFSIGRIPAETDAQARAAIAKILAAEREPHVGAQTLLADHLEADGAPAPEFAQEASDVAAALGPGANAAVETTQVANAHAEALALFSSPKDVVHFIGHAYSAGWTARSIFTDTDAAALTNAQHPVLFSFTCYDGEFDDPFSASVAGALVLNPTGGVRAAIADSAAENPGDHHRLHLWLARGISGAPIGEQLQAARAAYLAAGQGAGDVPFVFNLLGDPATPGP